MTIRPEDMFPHFENHARVRLGPGSVEVRDLRPGVYHPVTPDAWTVLQRCVGDKTIREIAGELAVEWDVSIAEVLSLILEANRRGILALARSGADHPIETFGSPVAHFPKVLSMELTTTCNIACTYCYGSYGPSRKEHLSLDDIPQVFRAAARAGATLVELTGGEPLAHPRFLDIFDLALASFDMVAIISNGILWKPALLDRVRDNLDRVLVQISLDGATEETTARVRQKSGTAQRSLDTIDRLVEMGAQFRVVVVLTNENKHELYQLAQMMRERGVKAFGVSIADGLGRGSELTYEDGKSLTNLRSPHSQDIIDTIAEMNRDFKDIVVNQETVRKYHESCHPEIEVVTTSCGAGDHSVAFRADGRVTGCQYMEEGVATLGNIHTDDLVTIFNGPRSEIMRRFYKDANDPSCMHCEYNGYCGSCMVRIYQSNLERLAAGRPLCGVVKRTHLDEAFDFKRPAKSNVNGLVQLRRGRDEPNAGTSSCSKA